MPDQFPLEKYRDYLQLLARMQVAPALAGKIDLSGIVHYGYGSSLDKGVSADRQILISILGSGIVLGLAMLVIWGRRQTAIKSATQSRL